MNNWLLVTVTLCSIPPSVLADDTLNSERLRSRCRSNLGKLVILIATRFSRGCVGEPLFPTGRSAQFP
jgi:hypothetical protein